MSVNGPISRKKCYHEIDYLFYSFYWLDSLEIRLDHNSTYYPSLSKNSDVKPRISHCDSQNLQYKSHPEFWLFHRQIFKTSLYYKPRLILETRRYVASLRAILLWVPRLLFCTTSWNVILFNSLAPRRFRFKWVIFKLTLVNGGWGTSNEIALRWMPLEITDDKSTLVQVMAWCRQATSHYLSQCWPRPMSPYGVSRP